jgi:general secretion pathway protein H
MAGSHSIPLCAPDGAEREKPNPARGFTLIEMLVVLLIVGMALTAVPALLGSLPGARLRAAADDMAGTLRTLRSAAVQSGAGTALLLDPATRSYATLPGGARHALPDIVASIDVRTTAPLVPGGGRLFRFFGDGTASGGTITLHHGDQAASVAVDWLTGRVHRLD